jgi:hypothetical protein
MSVIIVPLSQLIEFKTAKGPSINNVTTLGVGVKGYQGFCDNSTIALLLKTVTMEGGVSKIIKNCVKSFIDDPKV